MEYLTNSIIVHQYETAKSPYIKKSIKMTDSIYFYVEHIIQIDEITLLRTDTVF